MGTETKIEWCHHTWNPVRGCVQVSPGCDNCYAAAMSSRNPAVLGHWGAGAERVFGGADYWKQPARWNRAAVEAGEIRRVFVASLADVCEGDQVDGREQARGPRADYLPMLDRMVETFTPLTNLRVLVLTKRPWNMARWARDRAWPWNWWAGTTVETHNLALARMGWLKLVPAPVRFLSCEPLLDGITLGGPRCGTATELVEQGVGWVIGGGESGPNARPWNPAWARSLRDACLTAGVPFLWKQHGEWTPDQPTPHETEVQTPRWIFEDGTPMWRVGKKAAGRALDGVIHDGYPGSFTPVGHATFDGPFAALQERE